MQKIFGKLIRMFMVMAAACCITAFAGGAVSVKAAESNPVVTEQAQTSDGETSEEQRKWSYASSGRNASHYSGYSDNGSSNSCSYSTCGGR